MTQMHQKNTLSRLLSLDVFRGITIAVMILVNSPGNGAAWPWLEHSGWDGCTLADLVFPFFIVIVGMTSVLVLTQLQSKGVSKQILFKKIAKRAAWIFLMGLLLNAFPKHLTLIDLRILGVLQRIAICYFVSSVLFLTTTKKQQTGIILALLVSYWLLMAGFSGVFPLSVNSNLVGYIDQWLFSSRHLYTPMFDPEGLLSTLPAIATALLGNILGFCLVSGRSKQQQLQWMVFAGCILLAIGYMWSLVFPLNKSLWSSSYVLWTGGLAFLVYASCFVLIEIKQWQQWSKPFALFGKNAMQVYMLHILFLKIQAMIPVHTANGELVNLRVYLTDLFFGNITPVNASLCYAAAYTLFWLFILKCITKWRSYPSNPGL